MRTYNSYYGTSTASPAYSDGDIARIINNTDTDNLNWGMEQVNDALRYLTTKYFWNEQSVTLNTKPGVQFYPLPSQLKKLVNVTVTIGNVIWQPRECSSREFWDALNVIQFEQEFPYYFFIWGGQVGIWPTPTNSTDLITINYKARITDLSMPDVTNSTTGSTLSAINGSTKITATGGTAPFLAWMAQSTISQTQVGSIISTSGTTATYNTTGDWSHPIDNGTEIQFTDIGSYVGISTGTNYWLGNVTNTTFTVYSDVGLTSAITITGSGIATFETYATEISNPAGSASAIRIPFTSSNSTCGDNQWYPIAKITSGTTAYLSMPYQGQSVTGAPFTIGQVPLLIEDYQDLPLYRMGYLYYTTRFPDPTKAGLYKSLYDTGEEKLNDEFSNKSKNVVLSDIDQPLVNPNLFTPKIS